MTTRFLLPLAMTVMAAPLAFGQSWTVFPNGPSVVYPTPVYSAANTQPVTVWRETMNGHSVRPVTYPTAAYSAPAYGTTRQVYYTSAVPTNNACASPLPTSYPPISQNTAQYVHYTAMPVAPGNVPGYGYYSGSNGKYYVGYGLFGQPKAFGRNEPVRNALRYLLP